MNAGEMCIHAAPEACINALPARRAYTTPGQTAPHVHHAQPTDAEIAGMFLIGCMFLLGVALAAAALLALIKYIVTGNRRKAGEQ